MVPLSNPSSGAMPLEGSGDKEVLNAEDRASVQVIDGCGND
jgi:hypothetical protein